MTERILSAGVVVVRDSGNGWRLLLLRAYNYWDFPKGQVEPGEDPLTTAKREVREETAIDDLDFRWGEEFIETGPYGRNKVARYYLAISPAARVELPVSPVLGRPEHEEFRWFDFDAARALVAPRVATVIGWARGAVAA